MSKDLVPSPEEIKAIEIMAKNANESKFVNNLGGAPGILSIMLYAKEIGVPLMQAVFGGLQNIMGKIQISPQLMNSMIRKAGHKLEIDSSDVKCTIKGTRNDTGESCTVSFSVEDAKRAGIFKTAGGWDKYPSDMCFARALSRLARRLFPDVIGTAYVEGEFEAEKPQKEARKERFETKQEVLEAEAEIVKADEPSEEEVNIKFNETFGDMNSDEVFEYFSSLKNQLQGKVNALKNPEGFRKFMNDKKEKKP